MTLVCDDPCDDWHPTFTFRLGRMLRYATGTPYAPQFELCDDCSHWVMS